MKPTTPQLECTSGELAAILNELEDAARVFAGFPGWERSMERLVGLLTRAELQVATGDAAAERTIARIDVLMSTPLRNLGPDAIPSQRPASSHPRTRGAALGPMEHMLVNVTREGIRSEESFFRSVFRSEFARQLGTDGPKTEVLATEAAATIAGVTPKTIRAWVASRRLVPLGGRPYKFHRATVEAARDRKPSGQNVIDYDARAEEILDRKRRQ